MRPDASPEPGRRRLIPRAAVVAGASVLAVLAWGAVPASAIGPPSASFTFSPTGPVTGESVRFDASSTTETAPQNPQARVYDWDFDGNFDFADAHGVVVSHAFPAAGTYPVALRVTGSDGFSQSAIIHNVTVAPNQLPLASFFAVPRRPAVNEVVQLTSTSSDPDGQIRSQSWDLDGDGAFDDASGGVAFTVFTSPGTRLLRLRVVDNSGAVAIGNLIVEVGDVAAARLPLISPFPVVRLAGSLTNRGAKVRILSVTAPAGSRVVVRCRGRLCPLRRAVTRIRRAGRPVRIRSFQRRLQAGVVLEVLVSETGRIGKHTRFLIRHGRAPKRRDGCLLPGSTTRSSCPRR